MNFLAEDLAMIMASGLAENVFFKPQDGTGIFSLKGMFEAPSQEVTAGTASAPLINQIFTLAICQMENQKTKRDDIFTIRGEDYRVIKVGTDGQGLVNLTLHRVKI